MNDPWDMFFSVRDDANTMPTFTNSGLSNDGLNLLGATYGDCSATAEVGSFEELCNMPQNDDELETLFSGDFFALLDEYNGPPVVVGTGVGTGAVPPNDLPNDPPNDPFAGALPPNDLNDPFAGALPPNDLNDPFAGAFSTEHNLPPNDLNDPGAFSTEHNLPPNDPFADPDFAFLLSAVFNPDPDDRKRKGDAEDCSSSKRIRASVSCDLDSLFLDAMLADPGFPVAAHYGDPTFQSICGSVTTSFDMAYLWNMYCAIPELLQIIGALKDRYGNNTISVELLDDYSAFYVISKASAGSTAPHTQSDNIFPVWLSSWCNRQTHSKAANKIKNGDGLVRTEELRSTNPCSCFCGAIFGNNLTAYNHFPLCFLNKRHISNTLSFFFPKQDLPLLYGRYKFPNDLLPKFTHYHVGWLRSLIENVNQNQRQLARPETWTGPTLVQSFLAYDSLFPYVSCQFVNFYVASMFLRDSRVSFVLSVCKHVFN